MKTASTSPISIAPELAQAVHSLPATDTTPAPACLNCGAAVPDHFCGHCGQDLHHTHRFTMRYLLLHDLPHSVWHVDKGVLYTLRMMLTRPGLTIAEYLAGRRARHFRPIAFMLLLGGLSALFMSALHLQPIPPDKAAEMPRVLNLAMERYMTLLYKYPSLIYTVLLPLNALLARWLLRATGYNYAEMLIGQALITGALTVPALLMLAPLVGLSRNPAYNQQLSLLLILPSLLYPTWVYLQLLASTPLPTAGRWLRAVGTSLLQLLAMMVACVGLVVYLVVSMLNQDPALKADLKAKVGKKPGTEQAPPVRR